MRPWVVVPGLAVATDRHSRAHVDCSYLDCFAVQYALMRGGHSKKSYLLDLLRASISLMLPVTCNKGEAVLLFGVCGCHCVTVARIRHCHLHTCCRCEEVCDVFLYTLGTTCPMLR